MVTIQRYDAASTKDTAHVRRTKGRIGKTVRLHLNNQLSMSKSNFILSKDNQQNFLLMLVDELTKTGIAVNHASGDVGLLIVQTALKTAKDYPTVLFTLHMNQNRASNQQKFGMSVMQSKF